MKIKSNFNMLYSFLILVPLCACLDFEDKREENEIYNLYNIIKDQHTVKLSEILPGDWKFVCAIPPGSPPSISLRHLLPLDFYIHTKIEDPDDFPDHLWKLILLGQSGQNMRMLLIDKRDFEFRGIFCAHAKDKILHFTETKETYNGKERSVFLIKIK